jgi:ribonuclease E
MPLFDPRDDEPRSPTSRLSEVTEPQAYTPPIAALKAAEPTVAAAQAPAEPVAAPTDYELPIDSLVAVADRAGLQWVNSDAEKIRAAQEAMAAMPTPIHVPREIRKVELADDGPLVLVETKKDLSQVRLPFENQAPNA